MRTMLARVHGALVMAYSLDMTDDVLGYADARGIDGDGLDGLMGDPVELSRFMTDYVYAGDDAPDDGSPKRVHVVFCIPRKRYKNSNTSGNRIADQAKSQWLRAHAEQVWAYALEKQHGIVAVEPDEVEWRTHDDSNESGDDDGILHQESIVNGISEEIESLRGMSKDVTRWRREYRRTSDEAVHVRITDYEDRLSDARERLKYEKKLLTMLRNDKRKTERRDATKRRTVERKAYIAAKMRLNRDKRLFNGPVRMMVRTNMVTDHVFDAPNSWPSVKPIQDGGTDTAILWEDDNNDYIHSTTFYGGWRTSREYYVIEIIVEAIPEDEPMENPFGDTIMLPDRAMNERNKKTRKPRARRTR